MDIIVQGLAKKTYKADQVEISLSFLKNCTTYDDSLHSGIEMVKSFIEEVLEPLNISIDKFQTFDCRVEKKQEYSSRAQKYVDKGYDYIQHANIKLDYDKDLIADFIEKIKNVKKPPKYNLMFNIKDVEAAKAEVMSEAYRKAQEKAEIIAMSAGEKLKDCVKVDFKPFKEGLISSINSDDEFEYEARDNMKFIGAAPDLSSSSMRQVVKNMLTPEDVEVVETLYCLWLTK